MDTNEQSKKSASSSEMSEQAENSPMSSDETKVGSNKVLILGMHRSGTSMISALVSKFGVHQLGNRPMDAAADNPNGFFEDQAIRELNDDLLASINSAWDIPVYENLNNQNSIEESLLKTARNTIFNLNMDCGSPWFVKDPRILLLRKPWERILLGAPAVVFTVRDPLECARSLVLRNGISYKRALALWFVYTSKMLDNWNERQSIVIDYGRTIKDPEGTMRGLAAFLSANLIRYSGEKFNVNQEFEFQVNPNPHSGYELVDVQPTLIDECNTLYAKISAYHLGEMKSTFAELETPQWVIQEIETARKDRKFKEELFNLEEQFEKARSLSHQESERADVLSAELDVVREQVARELLVRENLAASVEALDRELLLKGEETLSKDAALLEASSKADVLNVELTDVWDELLSKDAALLEASSKADVLGVELMAVREQAVEDLLVRENLVASVEALDRELLLKGEELFAKNTELDEIKISRIDDKKLIDQLQSERKRKMGQIESLDRELAQLAIKAVMFQETVLQNEELIRQNKSLHDGFYWVVRDLNSVTGTRRYSTFRKVRLIFSAIFHFRIRGASLRDDVLPYDAEPSAYIEGVLKCGFTADEYLSVYEDVASKQINPYTHFLTVGEKEKRRVG